MLSFHNFDKRQGDLLVSKEPKNNKIASYISAPKQLIFKTSMHLKELMHKRKEKERKKKFSLLDLLAHPL